jgi:hypothetical protein
VCLFGYGGGYVMSHYREPKDNEGHDGFIWSKRLFAVIMALGIALIGAGNALAGGFSSWGY